MERARDVIRRPPPPRVQLIAHRVAQTVWSKGDGDGYDDDDDDDDGDVNERRGVVSVGGRRSVQAKSGR